MNELTKLEQVASMAMQGILSYDGPNYTMTERIASKSVEIALALLAECAKHQAPVTVGHAPWNNDAIARQTADKDGWIKHVPGDPMPCDPDSYIEYELADGFRGKEPACVIPWEETTSHRRIKT